jgi:hypothetical protein
MQSGYSSLWCSKSPKPAREGLPFRAAIGVIDLLSLWQESLDLGHSILSQWMRPEEDRHGYAYTPARPMLSLMFFCL